jgi:hypothetical protein
MSSVQVLGGDGVDYDNIERVHDLGGVALVECLAVLDRPYVLPFGGVGNAWAADIGARKLDLHSALYRWMAKDYLRSWWAVASATLQISATTPRPVSVDEAMKPALVRYCAAGVKLLGVYPADRIEVWRLHPLVPREVVEAEITALAESWR